MTVGPGQGSESHQWSFRARTPDLVIGSTGAGRLTLSTAQTGNRGRPSLRFSPRGTVRQRACGGRVAGKSRPMVVSGIAYRCRDGSVTRTATDTGWFGTVTNGTRALSVPAQVFGSVSVPNGNTASIGRQTS